MTKPLYVLSLLLLAAMPSFSQFPSPIDTFYHRLFLRNSDVQGVTVDTTYQTTIMPLLKNAYSQKFSMGTVKGCMINLILFQTNKNAADSINVFRQNIACPFYPGLWSEFNHASIGDSCWYGNCLSPSIIVWRENLMLQISVIFSSDTQYRATIIAIANKIMDKFTANAVCMDRDTVSENCATSSLPSDASVWNFTGDTLQIDSIKVEYDKFKFPQCALMFSIMAERSMCFVFNNDTVKEHIDCIGSSPSCKIYDYNRMVSGSGIQKMKIRPWYMEPFFQFRIDTHLDSLPAGAVINYCADSLATIEARIVFYAGNYSASVLVTGWINAPSTGVVLRGKAVHSPARLRYSSRQYYDVLGRKIPQTLMRKNNKQELIKAVYLKVKPQ
jgi:hypothetical protein